MSIKMIQRVTLTDELNLVVNSTMSKSQKIKTLYSHSIPKVQIAELLEIRYQHVRNVLTQVPKKVSTTQVDPTTVYQG